MISNGYGIHDKKLTQNAVREFLVAIGEDPDREGLLGTPERVARMCAELFAGYSMEPVDVLNGAIFEAEYSGPVVVNKIDFSSLCEHHLLPFIGRVYVSYLPKGKVLGLSKIPRIVEMFSRRLQIQERMTHQIASYIHESISPAGVAVYVEAVHMCAVIRGVRKVDVTMSTMSTTGIYVDDDSLRREFLSSVKQHEPISLLGR